MRSLLGALVVGLFAAAACSQTNADPSAKGPVPKKDIPKKDTSQKDTPQNPKKDTPKKDTPNMAAEAILTKHYADKGWGKPVELVRYERVPHLYRVDFADKGDYAVVHNGKVLEGKGVDAMAAYMKDVKLMSEHKLQPDDVLGLLLAFHAFPPVQDIDPEGYYALDRVPKLKPKLELGVDEGRLTLNYVFPRKGGASPNPSLVTVKRWTLDVPKSYAAKWTEETVKVDVSKP